MQREMETLIIQFLKRFSHYRGHVQGLGLISRCHCRVTRYNFKKICSYLNCSLESISVQVIFITKGKTKFFPNQYLIKGKKKNQNPKLIPVSQIFMEIHLVDLQVNCCCCYFWYLLEDAFIKINGLLCF